MLKVPGDKIANKFSLSSLSPSTFLKIEPLADHETALVDRGGIFFRIKKEL